MANVGRLRPVDHAVCAVAGIAGAVFGAAAGDRFAEVSGASGAFVGALLGAGLAVALVLAAYGRLGAALAGAALGLVSGLLVFGASGGDTAVLAGGSLLVALGAVTVAVTRARASS